MLLWKCQRFKKCTLFCILKTFSLWKVEEPKGHRRWNNDHSFTVRHLGIYWALIICVHVLKLRASVYFFIHASTGLSLPEWLPAPFSLQKDLYSFPQCLLTTEREWKNLAITEKIFNSQKSNFSLRNGAFLLLLIFPGKLNCASLLFFIKNWLQFISVHPKSDGATPSPNCYLVAPVVMVVVPIVVKGSLSCKTLHTGVFQCAKEEWFKVIINLCECVHAVGELLESGSFFLESVVISPSIT